MVHRFNYRFSSKFQTSIMSWRLNHAEPDNKTSNLISKRTLISHQIRIIFFIFPNSNEANQENVGIVSWFKHSLTMRESSAHFFGPSVFDIVCISKINTYYNALQAALKTLQTFWNDLKCVTLFDKDVDRSAKKTSVWCSRHEYKTHIFSLSIIKRWKHLHWYFVVCTIYLFFKYKCT